MRYQEFVIIESIYLTDTEKTEVARTWCERLFSWPWRPRKKTKMVYREVPKQELYVMGDKVICHPVIAAKLREAIEAQQ